MYVEWERQDQVEKHLRALIEKSERPEFVALRENLTFSQVQALIKFLSDQLCRAYVCDLPKKEED